ncbi:P-loop containing nucleoside triphosphate hydrolase protein [Hyaloraphidium curvatum]|nr:P-loop containing nucleoside triphosphate hydrolase protein [Hyaloraphidium curvatum]
MVSYEYVTWLIRKGYRNENLGLRDFPKVQEADSAADLSDAILYQWNREVLRCAKKDPPARPSIWRVIFHVFGGRYSVCMMLAACEEVTKISNAILLGFLLRWLRDPTQTASAGHWMFYIVRFPILSCRQSLTFGAQSIRTGFQMRVGFIASVYRKLLHLSLSHTSSTGVIVNLVSNDVQKLEDWAPFAYFLILGPVESLIVGVILIIMIGVGPALAGLAALYAIIPLQAFFANRFSKYRKETVRIRDDRIRSTSDVLFGINVVKLYAWEEPFEARLNEMRDQEIAYIKKASVFRAINDASYYFTTAIIGIVTWGTAWALGETLTADKVFTALFLFQLTRLTMANNFTKAVQFGAESLISVKRLRDFFELPEIGEEGRRNNTGLVMLDTAKIPEFPPAEDPPPVGPGALNKTVKESTTSLVHTPKLRTILQDISLELKPGKLTAIVGPVGAGKSSTILAILGEMITQRGSVRVLPDKVAYCPQSPWIVSGTVRDNIVFGGEFEQAKFDQTIADCALGRDLELLPKGADSLIGERGVQLSGGQRARLSLARAVYSDAQLYLLDDPLSAVDAAVGRHLFENTILGKLTRERNKAVLLVTHQLQFVRNADAILVLENGGIQAQGSWADIVGDPSQDKQVGTPFIEVLKEFERTADVGMDVDIDDLAGPDKEDSADDKATAIQIQDDTNKEFVAEDRAVGSVKGGVYLEYFSRGGGKFMAFFLLSMMALGEALRVMCDWWLSSWTNQSPESQRNPRNLAIYGGLVAGLVCVSLTRALIFYMTALASSNGLSRDALHCVMSAPLSWFQTNPHGRVLNRFSKDLNQIDEMLPLTMFDFLQCCAMISGVLVLACVLVPWVLILIPFLAGIFWIFRRLYIRTSRQVKRLESVSRSPVYSAIPATLDGLSVIRAFRAGPRFVTRFFELQDINSTLFYSFISCARWVGFRLDMLCGFFLGATAFLCVGLRDSLTPGLVGLLLSYISQLLGLNQWAVRQSTEVENLMVATERVLEYTKLPSEPPAHTDVKPPPGWPMHGEVDIKDMSLTYPVTNQKVLNGITVSVSPGSKVGIVGRTGAGKSSFISALFRLVEPDPEKCVVIDGLATSTLGLADLRSSISIIPQEPFLFKGTLRFNIDPFNRYGDERIWNALEVVELKDKVSRLPGKLDSAVLDQGGNWSVGERQLICVARAVLKNTRLIVMDEATANIDLSTDRLIQAAIRSETGLFAQSTVLCVAHRLQTIIDYDLIMVMDSGELAEFGTPHELLQKPDGRFRSMVHETGPEAEEMLRNIALEKEQKRLARLAEPQAGAASNSEAPAT